MGTRWRKNPLPPSAYRAAYPDQRGARRLQDAAAGGASARKLDLVGTTKRPNGSIRFLAPRGQARVYAQLVWNYDRKRHYLSLGEVTGPTLEVNLRISWQRVHAERLRDPAAREAWRSRPRPYPPIDNEGGAKNAAV